MRSFPVLVFAVVTAAVTSGLAVGATSATASPHAADTSFAWGTAQQVPGLGALNAGGDAVVTSVSCASAGNCTAGGYYKPASASITSQAFAADETNGTWNTAQTVPGTAALNTGGLAEVTSVSCASAGNCTAGGFYATSSLLTEAFVADEINGTWNTAEEVPGTATLNTAGLAEIFSVACPSAGNCTAGGLYAAGSVGNATDQAFVADETNGTWNTAEEVPGTATLNTSGDALVRSVACASAGNCTAAGDYKGSSGWQAFVADETNGTWNTAEEVPGTATLNAGGNADVFSVACPSAGNCTAAGPYRDSNGHSQAFVADETNGTWNTAEEIPGTAKLNAGGNAPVNSVACASAGNCTAAGDYKDSSGHSQAFVADETNGTWNTAEEIPGTATLNTAGDAGVKSVSCASAGNCSAGGFYEDSFGRQQAFLVNETSGTWDTAEEVPGTAALNTAGDAGVDAVSCVPAGSCAAGGSYSATSGGGTQGFVDGEQVAHPKSTSTSLSAATVFDGLRLTATVTASGSTASPAGTVTFTDNSTSLGTATVKASGSGKAIATALDSSLPAGVNDFKAVFSPGDPTAFAGSSGTLTENLPAGKTWVRPGSPAISGTAAVGDTLTAKPGTWGPSGVRLAYQWRANGSAIKGATRATLGLGTAEFGKKITVTVTGSASGDITVSVTSPATGTVGKGTLRSSVPKITGTARVGDTLKVALGTWTPGTGFKYQWLANGKAIPKATGSSLKLTRAQQGKKISVRVTGSKTDYNPATKTSAQTRAVAT